MAVKSLKKSKEVSKLGEWAFLGGVVLAILIGLVPQLFVGAEGLISLVLVVAGLLVGLINVGSKETHEFLLAGVALLVASTGGVSILPVVGSVAVAVLTNIISFVAPAVVIVALKAVYEHGR